MRKRPGGRRIPGARDREMSNGAPKVPAIFQTILPKWHMRKQSRCSRGPAQREELKIQLDPTGAALDQRSGHAEEPMVLSLA